jgi:hypothetical protein
VPEELGCARLAVSAQLVEEETGYGLVMSRVFVSTSMRGTMRQR